MTFLNRPPQTIKAQGNLLLLDTPIVMGIINVTPDSFYSHSRSEKPEDIASKALQMVEDGAKILDIGAYSSRPGATEISEKEEMARLDTALTSIRKVLPQIPISVDTFRSNIAKQIKAHFNIDFINDISGGDFDDKMFATVANLNIGYILMHMAGNPQTMQNNPTYNDVVSEVSLYLSKQIEKLTYAGVTDVIIDPGFGFGKTVEHNYEMLAKLEEFELFNKPLLVGLSRKSMIYKPLNTTPLNALNGTSILHTIALQKGAKILRVHDVKEAVECIKLVDIVNKGAYGIS